MVKFSVYKNTEFAPFMQVEMSCIKGVYRERPVKNTYNFQENAIPVADERAGWMRIECLPPVWSLGIHHPIKEPATAPTKTSEGKCCPARTRKTAVTDAAESPSAQTGVVQTEFG